MRFSATPSPPKKKSCALDIRCHTVDIFILKKLFLFPFYAESKSKPAFYAISRKYVISSPPPPWDTEYLLYLYSHFISSNSHPIQSSSSCKPFSLSFSLIFQLSLFCFFSSSFPSLSFRPPLSIFTLPFDSLLPPSLIFLFFSLPLFSSSPPLLIFLSFLPHLFLFFALGGLWNSGGPPPTRSPLPPI